MTFLKKFYGENLEELYEKTYDQSYNAALTSEMVEFRDSIPKDDQDDVLLGLLEIIGKQTHPMYQAIEIKKYLAPFIHFYATNRAESEAGHEYDRRAA